MSYISYLLLPYDWHWEYNIFPIFFWLIWPWYNANIYILFCLIWPWYVFNIYLLCCLINCTWNISFFQSCAALLSTLEIYIIFISCFASWLALDLTHLYILICTGCSHACRHFDWASFLLRLTIVDQQQKQTWQFLTLLTIR